jgi:DNA-binding CsgD family transcriptional regulator
MNETFPHASLYRFLSILLLAIVVAGTVDLILDAPSTVWSLHILVEICIVTMSLGTAIFLWWSWHRARQDLVVAGQVLRENQRERDAWRARAQKILRGLGEEIDEQLGEWGLTPVERQTALMLLKGLSHKEIAHLSDKSERTVRQHAIAVYRKSGLGGRAELSAFFLEDLLLPLQPEDGQRKIS